jgi:hypothetical protein
MGDAARMFFGPVEPFLIDDAPDHKRAGRISRVSLEPIWEWIGRDLIPAEAKALGDDINRALLAKDRVKAEQRTRALHDRALLRIREAMASVTGDDKARRLPNHLRTFERDQIDSVNLLLEAAIAQKSQSGASIAKADVFLYGFVLIMGRGWQRLGSSFALLRAQPRRMRPRASRRRRMGGRSPWSSARSSAW